MNTNRKVEVRSLFNRSRLFFISFLAGIGKKQYLIGKNEGKNLPITHKVIAFP